MSKEFNKLEKTIIAYFIAQHKNTVLAVQLASAKLVDREWTQVGFVVQFEVDQRIGKIDFSDSSFQVPLTGPEIKSDDIEHGAGTLLWENDGYADCIEMFCYGSEFKEHVHEFELSSSAKMKE